jgi:hypothetical protein
LPLDLTAQILHDVNEIDAQRNNVAKQAWIAANVLTHDAMYLDIMAVSDMLLVARLKRAVGTAYLQKLLGLTTSPSGLHRKAELLRDKHHALRTKLRKAQPEACVAEADAWLAGTDKSPANAPRGKKNCSCEVCGAVVRNKPLKTPAKQKSHHKQQPDFTPRPAGRLDSSNKKGRTSTKSPTSTKKGKGKNRKRRGDDTSLEKLDRGGDSMFDKSQSLDRAVRGMSRELHKQVVEAGVRDYQRTEMLEEVREVAVRAIENEAARADHHSNRADSALTLRDISERKLVAAEAKSKIDTDARVAAEEKAVAAEEKAAAAEEDRVAAVERVSAAVAAEEKMRALKNSALSKERAAQQKSAEFSKVLKDNRRLRALLGGVEHKTPRQDLRPQCKEEYTQQIAGLKQDNLRLVDELDEACDIIKSTLSDSAREGIDPFLRLVGKKGEPYSQDMIELGLKLMSRSLSSVQAWGVMMDYGTSLHPNLKPGEDYRVPSASQFRVWRRLLQPMCRYIALAAVEDSDFWFYLGDESPKDGHSVFGTSYRVVKDGRAYNVAGNFSVIANGLCETEGQQIVNDLTLSLDGGKTALKKVTTLPVGGCTDNAPTAIAGQEYANKLMIANMKEQEAWGKLTPEQQSVVTDIKITRCANHGTHKVCEASVKNETKVLKQLMTQCDKDAAAKELVDLPGIVREADPDCAELEQPTAVSAVLRATSKLFAPQGEHGRYHLNEHAALVAWMEKQTLSLVLQPLPSFKGSRQMILLELAADIAANRPIYQMYLKSGRQEGDPNKLVDAVRVGLSNKYIVAAFHARAYSFIAFAAPSRFVLNTLTSRMELHGVMECMEGVVDSLAELKPYTRLLDKVGAFQSEWKGAMGKWSACVKLYHDMLMELVEDGEYRPNTVLFLGANIHCHRPTINTHPSHEPNWPHEKPQAICSSCCAY